MKRLLAMTAVAAAVAGCTSDTLPDSTGNSFGQLDVTGTAESGGTLTATVTDANGVDPAAISYTWMADGVAIENASASNLLLTDAQAGTNVSVSVSYTDNDDYAETATSSSIAVMNHPATFSGELSTTLSNNDASVQSGSLMVSDMDGADEVIAQMNTLTSYGTFSITSDGMWSYSLNTEDAAVMALNSEADMLTDTIGIESADGTQTDVVVTITGFTNLVAVISDTDDGDTGELRYKFPQGQTSGKVAMKFQYGVEETETAYVSLFNSGNSTSSLIAELQFNEGVLKLRGEDNFNNADDNSGFTPGDWYDVVFMWDNTSADEAGSYTVMLNDVTYGPYTSQNTTPGEEVTALSIRLSSNSKMASDVIYIDDLAIYADESASVLVHSDTFQAYTVGDSLGTDNSESVYDSKTFSAVVAAYGQQPDDSPDDDGGDDDGGDDTPTDDIGPGTPGNKVAQILDTMDSDAGELRLKLDSAATIAKGKLTVAFNKLGDFVAPEDGNTKEAYIAVYGNSTSTYNAMVDLRINSDDYDYAIRHNRDDATRETPDMSGFTFTSDTWTEVEIAWDATGVDVATQGPLVTVSIDGMQVSSEAFASFSESLSDVMTGARTFMFKLADTGRTVPNGQYLVDNIKIYSTDANGTDTIVFEENFEGYDEGASLDNAPYDSATNEATVVVEQ